MDEEDASFQNSRHQIKHQTDGDFSSKHAELQFHHWFIN
jgi:hypothetical protein